MCISANVCPCRCMHICAPVCVLKMCMSRVCVTKIVTCVSFAEHACFHVNVSVYERCVSLSTGSMCVSPSVAWRPAWLCVYLL